MENIIVYRMFFIKKRTFHPYVSKILLDYPSKRESLEFTCAFQWVEIPKRAHGFKNQEVTDKIEYENTIEYL